MSGVIEFIPNTVSGRALYKATLRTRRVIVSAYDVSREKALARALNDIGYEN
jgi:hypothetical protein